MFYVCSVTAPPVLTPERIDAMLSIMAEVCLEAVVEAGQRQKTAEEAEAFERAGRALQGACRNLRQTIALKQRFDREQARKADDARRAEDAARAEAECRRLTATTRQQIRVRRHFERVLWNEYEEDEAQALFNDLDDRLGDLAEEPDFLDTPAETLIQRLADAIGLDDKPEDDPPAAEPAAIPPPSPPPPVLAPPVIAAPPEPDQEPDPPEPCADASPPEPPPPELPPEPPYIPPWEHLRPGQYFPGGTGW